LAECNSASNPNHSVASILNNFLFVPCNDQQRFWDTQSHLGTRVQTQSLPKD
jgi:phage major head subunit gpT-like protein